MPEVDEATFASYLNTSGMSDPDLLIRTAGELCSHVVDGSPTVNAYFGAKQVTYSGAHKRARVTDGMIASTRSFLGAQASVGLTVRW